MAEIKKTRSQHREDRFKKILVFLIGIAFIISGVNGGVRTYCLTLPGLNHPKLVHDCLAYTTPGAYVASVATILIGVIIIFLDSLLNWLIGHED